MGAFKSYHRFKKRATKQYHDTMDEQRANGQKYAQERLDAIRNRSDNVENSSQQVKKSFDDIKDLPTKTIIKIVIVTLLIIAFIVIGFLS